MIEKIKQWLLAQGNTTATALISLSLLALLLLVMFVISCVQTMAEFGSLENELSDDLQHLQLEVRGTNEELKKSLQMMEEIGDEVRSIEEDVDELHRRVMKRER